MVDINIDTSYLSPNSSYRCLGVPTEMSLQQREGPLGVFWIKNAHALNQISFFP